MDYRRQGGHTGQAGPRACLPSGPMTNPRPTLPRFAATLLASLSLSLTGCFLAAGPALGVAVNAADTTGRELKRGKLRLVYNVPFPEMSAALDQAMRELSLEVRNERPVTLNEDGDPVRRRFEVYDRHGWVALVQLTARTETMTALRIKVGLFGDRGSAALIAIEVSQAVRRLGFVEDANPPGDDVGF